MAKEATVPDELKVLLPEQNKAVVVIGSKGYEMVPMVEGQIEKLTIDMSELWGVIYNADRKCEKCGKVYRDAVIKEIAVCSEEACGKHLLADLRKGPIDAIVGSGKIPSWVETILELDAATVKKGITYNQMRHFAAEFWRLNFSDEGLPKETVGNFEKLLEMLGMPRRKKEEAPGAKAEAPKE